MIDNYSDLYEKLEFYIKDEKELEKINLTYFFAKNAHEGQFRKSGEAYIIHPINVAYILAKLKMPPTIIKAALLHDVIEDCDYTYDDIKETFDGTIADIVEGVTKIGEIKFETINDAQAANHYKLLLAMSKDLRVIIVKLADRLHNLKTLDSMSPEKQKIIANETLEIYAPLAHRLGMYQIKWELEDLSLKYINPDIYKEISGRIKMKRKTRDAFVDEMIEELQKDIKENQNIDAKILGRSKNIYSIYKKMHQKNKTFEEIFDLFAFRVVVSSINECYSVLGYLHNQYKPIPNRFKDYIPTPKNNTYQSIHTAVLVRQGIPIEFQIRTKDMDRAAEYGIAMHWAYKENIDEEQIQDEINKKITWLRERIDVSEENLSSKELLDTFKSEVFTKNIFVYTPKGEIFELPQGSTVLDFAYYIHSDIGHHAISAKINGEQVVSLFYKLKIGDVVTIMTSKVSEPDQEWIHKVKTSRAKQSIKNYFKDQMQSEILEKGESLFNNILKVQDDYFELMELFESDQFNVIIEEYSYVSKSKIYEMIATGEISPNKVIDNMRNSLKKVTQEILEFKEVHIIDEDYNDNEVFKYNIQLSKCCNPLPGDEIFGVRNQYSDTLTFDIHNENCKVIKNMEKYEAEWTEYSHKKDYRTSLEINMNDEVGIISKILSIIAKEKLNVTTIYTITYEKEIALHVGFEVKNQKSLNKVIQKIKKVKNVIGLERK